MRPKLLLLTEFSSRNDKAQDELDFGTCNVDIKRTITIFLSNITEVTANWMLNYVKFPKKQTISKYTTTAWEEENLEKIDDPDVFEFSLAQVSVPSPFTAKLSFCISFVCLLTITLVVLANPIRHLGLVARKIRTVAQGARRLGCAACAKG